MYTLDECFPDFLRTTAAVWSGARLGSTKKTRKCKDEIIPAEPEPLATATYARARLWFGLNHHSLAMHASLIRRSLGGIVPPKIAAPTILVR